MSGSKSCSAGPVVAIAERSSSPLSTAMEPFFLGQVTDLPHLIEQLNVRRLEDSQVRNPGLHRQ
jgi:hypothetical protein